MTEEAAELLEELEEKVRDAFEEQELAGRVLRKLIRETLYEAKLARAEVATLGERVAKLEEAVNRTALGAEDQLIEIRARLTQLESMPQTKNGTTAAEACAPFDESKALGAENLGPSRLR